MKWIGVVLAIGVLAAMVGGIGYGLVSGYGVLSVQWGGLSDEWRAVMSMIAAMILFAALFVSFVITAAIHREGSRNAGRVEAYNAFIAWYSMLKASAGQVPEASTLAPTRNRIMLWGGNRVVQQINLLHELLAKGDAEFGVVLEKAGHVFLEIRRELGHRSMGVDRSIV